MDARQNLKPLTPKLWFRGVERSWLDSRLRTIRDFESENGRHFDVENLLADPLGSTRRIKRSKTQRKCYIQKKILRCN